MDIKFLDNKTIEEYGLRFNFIMVNSTAEVKKICEHELGEQEISALDFIEYKNYGFNKTSVYKIIKNLGKLCFDKINEITAQTNTKTNAQDMIENYEKSIMNIITSLSFREFYEEIYKWLKMYPFPYEIKYYDNLPLKEKYCYCSIKDLIVDTTLIYFLDTLIRCRKANIKNPRILKNIYLFYANDLEKDFEEYEECLYKNIKDVDKLIIKIINYRKRRMNLYIYNKPYFISSEYNNIQVYLEATCIMAVAYNELELKLTSYEDETTGKKCALEGCNRYFFPTGKQNRKKYCSPECKRVADRIKSNRCYAKKHKKKHSL